MNKYVEKIFFYWDFVSFVAILFASEALVVAIDGHDVNLHVAFAFVGYHE